MPAPRTEQPFDLSDFTGVVTPLKTKFSKLDHDYWSTDDNILYHLRIDKITVPFPSDFATITDGDRTSYLTEVFLSSENMAHGEARSLAVSLAKLLNGTPEQVSLLEAWPKRPYGTLDRAVDIQIRTGDRTYEIKIRESFDSRLPGCVLFTAYDKTRAIYGKPSSGEQ